MVFIVRYFPHLKKWELPLYEGGLVSLNQLFYTHTLGDKLSGSQHVIDNVFWEEIQSCAK